MPLKPIARQPVSDAVFAQLREEILSGRAGAGDALPSERALTEVFGVNRHAVREALKRLQQAGLVEVSQGGATRVLDLRAHGGLDLLPHLSLGSGGRVEPKVLRAALEMRISIGADAARLCARRATPSLAKSLREIAERLGAERDLAALVDLDTEFWGLVVDGADNIAYRLAFNSLIRSLRANQKKATALVADEVRDPASRVAVAEAIADGDAEDAERRARAALTGSLETALNLMSGSA